MSYQVLFFFFFFFFGRAYPQPTRYLGDLQRELLLQRERGLNRNTTCI